MKANQTKFVDKIFMNLKKYYHWIYLKDFNVVTAFRNILYENCFYLHITCPMPATIWMVIHLKMETRAYFGKDLNFFFHAVKEMPSENTVIYFIHKQINFL